MDALNILLVDDDELQVRLLKANLDRPGRVRCGTAASGDEALQQLARQPFDAVLTDLAMPGMDGVELVRRIRETDASLPVIVLTANATLEGAVEGIRAGATDFLAKPANVDAVLALVRRAVEERPIRDEVARAKDRRDAAGPDAFVAGRHPALDAVRRFAEGVARTPETRVLITGESGTGKSLLARLIHALSATPGRFVEVNCAALPPQLLEAELFGHEKGAFTDARAMKRGLVEMAERGTLLLDEIGALPLDMQAKLLLFLESREIRRVGGSHPIPVRVRVIAATNEDLRARVRERAFRQDLLYRLDVAAVRMPPLREMREVIPELADRFARQVSEEFGRPAPELAPGCVPGLSGYPWPGNARELRNAVERALIFHANGELDVAVPAQDPSDAPIGEAVRLEYGLSLEEVERRYLEATLRTHRGGLIDAATKLGISRKTLWEKRRRHGL